MTAEDVGTKDEDMSAIFSKTRFTTCIPPEVGFLESLSENLLKIISLSLLISPFTFVFIVWWQRKSKFTNGIILFPSRSHSSCLFNYYIISLFIKARGVIRALEATFSHIGRKSLEGATIAVQVTLM